MPLLVIRTNVIRAININGIGSPPKLRAKTSLGFGQGTRVDIRTFMYEVKKQPKMKKSAPKVNKISELRKIFEKPTEVDSTKVKRTWIEHLKWCSNHFDIKYGKAMTDARCRKIWKDTH